MKILHHRVLHKIMFRLFVTCDTVFDPALTPKSESK